MNTDSVGISSTFSSTGGGSMTNGIGVNGLLNDFQVDFSLREETNLNNRDDVAFRRPVDGLS